MTNKPNVAFLLTKLTKRGGISRVVSILSNEIYLTQLFTIHIIGYQKRELQGYKWNENLIFHELGGDESSMKKGMFKAAFRLRKILDAHKIKVIISSGQMVGPLAVLGTLFKRTKHVYWSHTSFKASTSNKYRVFNEKLTAPFSKILVCLTKADIRNYERETLARRVVQIYNPIDPVLENLETVYNADSNKIISVGRLTYQKNFELLVDVAKIILDKHKDYSWHIYGSGEKEKEIQAKIDKNDLTERLILMGQSNDLYSLYGNYSMMVMTSRYEGFPMTLLEGMACKLPLVSFDIPTGPNELIADNQNGFLIEPFDLEKMASKIEELILDKDRRRSFSRQNVELMAEFQIKSINDKWISLLKDLC
jgi:glycosyltransferase involved in cell wall biosynthesis